jgi:PKD repeat protein
VAFRDESYGQVTTWHWDFGDGKTSAEQHPLHQYEKPGEYTVLLTVEGPAGKARLAQVRDLVLK